MNSQDLASKAARVCKKATLDPSLSLYLMSLHQEEGMTNAEGAGTGALIVYTDHERLRGQRCEIWVNRHVSEMVQERVIKQTIFDRETWAAVFPYLPCGTHTLHIWTGSFTDFTIYADRVTELYEADYRDWEW